MNNNAKEWVKALRSGEYKQGREALSTYQGFCCLGVACELAVKAGVIPKPIDNIYGDNGDYNSLVLPTVVRVWLGLRDRSGEFLETDGKTDFLSNLNDRGENFANIADLIESEPQGLFVEEGDE